MTTKKILYLCLATLLTACGGNKEPQSNSPLRVKVAQVGTTIENPHREFSFIAQPFKTSELSFRVGGPIDQFEVYAGNHYRKGEVIAQIDARDFRLRRERTEAIYTQARAEYERVKALFEKNNLSATTFEKARAECTTAKTAFETASNELNDTRLIAPFDGYVGEVYMEKHQDVKATQPVLSFIDISQLRLETYVPQDIAFGTQQPTEVHLRFDADPTQVYSAPVAEISKSTTRNNLSYLLTALLPNKEGIWLGGMSGKIFFDAAPARTTTSRPTIPQTALCHRPTEGNYVWVVHPSSGTVSKRPVTIGTLLPHGQITISNGLQANETVAISGLRFLSDEMKITVWNEQSATEKK